MNNGSRPALKAQAPQLYDTLYTLKEDPNRIRARAVLCGATTATCGHTKPSQLATLAAEHGVIALLDRSNRRLELLLIHTHHDKHGKVLRVHVRVRKQALHTARRERA